ncbi:hypothetical protein MCAMS1_00702 [biofilm metagenome]
MRNTIKLILFRMTSLISRLVLNQYQIITDDWLVQSLGNLIHSCLSPDDKGIGKMEAVF